MKHKKKVISFQRKKLDFAVDKWKQRYGQSKSQKEEDSLPSFKTPLKKITTIKNESTSQSTQRENRKYAFEEKVKKSYTKEFFPGETIITGNHVGT